jgi:aminoglycoside N3'-acetyltransferase
MQQELSMWQNTVKARLYYVVRRCLSQNRRDELKKWQGRLRRRLSGTVSLIHGNYCAAELITNLKARISDDVEILMVHSSYDHLLPAFKGDPQEIVNALVDYCGSKRTLVMPAFCLGGRLRDKRGANGGRVFDVRKSPSEMGLLTELFRRRRGVRRSLHPTHSICALGPLADELVATHHLGSTRTGPGTPFSIMAQKRCVIAGLGVDWFRVITQTHIAEDTLGEEFPITFDKETFPVTLVDAKGDRMEYSLTLLRTARTLDNAILKSLLSPQDLRAWKFHGTTLFVTDAGKLTHALLEAARKGVTVYGTVKPRGRC